MSTIEEVKKELTPKYRGIYEKAITQRSPKSAIQTHCLRCTGCETKAIRDCQDESCEFHKYRPYQENPYKFHRPTNTSNLSRCRTGKIAKSRKNAPTSISKVIDVEKPTSGRLRIKVEVLPEK